MIEGFGDIVTTYNKERGVLTIRQTKVNPATGQAEEHEVNIPKFAVVEFTKEVRKAGIALRAKTELATA